MYWTALVHASCMLWASWQDLVWLHITSPVVVSVDPDNPLSPGGVLYSESLDSDCMSSHLWGGAMCMSKFQWTTEVSSFSGEFELLGPLTSDSSACSFKGRTSLVCLKTFRSGTISGICTLPITVLGGIQTSQVDKFLNTFPTHLEPGQGSP